MVCMGKVMVTLINVIVIMTSVVKLSQAMDCSGIDTGRYNTYACSGESNSYWVFPVHESPDKIGNKAHDRSDGNSWIPMYTSDARDVTLIAPKAHSTAETLWKPFDDSMSEKECIYVRKNPYSQDKNQSCLIFLQKISEYVSKNPVINRPVYLLGESAKNLTVSMTQTSVFGTPYRVDPHLLALDLPVSIRWTTNAFINSRKKPKCIIKAFYKTKVGGDLPQIYFRCTYPSGLGTAVSYRIDMAGIRNVEAKSKLTYPDPKAKLSDQYYEPSEGDTVWFSKKRNFDKESTGDMKVTTLGYESYVFMTSPVLEGFIVTDKFKDMIRDNAFGWMTSLSIEVWDVKVEHTHTTTPMYSDRMNLFWHHRNIEGKFTFLSDPMYILEIHEAGPGKLLDIGDFESHAVVHDVNGMMTNSKFINYQQKKNELDSNTLYTGTSCVTWFTISEKLNHLTLVLTMYMGKTHPETKSWPMRDMVFEGNQLGTETNYKTDQVRFKLLKTDPKTNAKTYVVTITDCTMVNKLQVFSESISEHTKKNHLDIVYKRNKKTSSWTGQRDIDFQTTRNMKQSLIDVEWRISTYPRTLFDSQWYRDNVVYPDIKLVGDAGGYYKTVFMAADPGFYTSDKIQPFYVFERSHDVIEEARGHGTRHLVVGKYHYSNQSRDEIPVISFPLLDSSQMLLKRTVVLIDMTDNTVETFTDLGTTGYHDFEKYPVKYTWTNKMEYGNIETTYSKDHGNFKMLSHTLFLSGQSQIVQFDFENVRYELGTNRKYMYGPDIKNTWNSNGLACSTDFLPSSSRSAKGPTVSIVCGTPVLWAVPALGENITCEVHGLPWYKYDIDVKTKGYAVTLVKTENHPVSLQITVSESQLPAKENVLKFSIASGLNVYTEHSMTIHLEYSPWIGPDGKLVDLTTEWKTTGVISVTEMKNFYDTNHGNYDMKTRTDGEYWRFELGTLKDLRNKVLDVITVNGEKYLDWYDESAKEAAKRNKDKPASQLGSLGVDFSKEYVLDIDYGVQNTIVSVQTCRVATDALTTTSTIIKCEGFVSELKTEEKKRPAIWTRVDDTKKVRSLSCTRNWFNGGNWIFNITCTIPSQVLSVTTWVNDKKTQSTFTQHNNNGPVTTVLNNVNNNILQRPLTSSDVVWLRMEGQDWKTLREIQLDMTTDCKSVAEQNPWNDRKPKGCLFPDTAGNPHCLVIEPPTNIDPGEYYNQTIVVWNSKFTESVLENNKKFNWKQQYIGLHVPIVLFTGFIIIITSVGICLLYHN
ncbi:hypothetical protein [Salmon gill poxvirus]